MAVTAAFRRTVSPWTRSAAGFGRIADGIESRRTLGYGVIVGLFALVTALRFWLDDPAAGVTSLYAVPIALAAVVFGVRAGLVASVAALIVFGALNAILSTEVDFAGYLMRAMLFAFVSVVTGAFAHRAREAGAIERELFQNAPVGYMSLSPDGVITALNETLLRWLGYGRWELVGRVRWVELLSPDSREPFEREFAAYLERGYVKDLEYELERRDGTTIQVLADSVAVKDLDGNLVRTLTTLFDNSARRETDEVNRRLAAIVESSADAISSLSPDGTIRSWNIGAERLYGYTATEAIGQGASLVTRPDPEGRTAEMLRAVRAGERIESHETVHLRKDGSPVEVSLTMAPILGSEGDVAGISVVVRDITERKRAQEEAERVKSEFFALVSHELRTPLTSISGYVDIIAEQERERLSEQGRRFFEVVQRSTRRLDRLVQDLLLVAQLEAGTFRIHAGVVRIEQVVDECAEELRPAAEEAGVALTLDLDAVPEFQGDANRLVQVVDNLVSNAIKFTPRGGRVEISTREQDGDCVLEVTDTGVGIGPEELRHLFDRFYRASIASREGIKGVGLGLAITKAIVEQHRGRVEIESEPDRGSTFRVLIPLLLVALQGEETAGGRASARSRA